MKRILFKSFAIAAMALISGNAWAEWDKSSAVYCQELDTNYDDLNTAFNEIVKQSEKTEITLKIYKSVELTNRLTLSKENSITTISIQPQNDNIVISRKSGLAKNSMMFLVNKGSAKFIIGNNQHKLTIQGKESDIITAPVFCAEQTANLTIENMVVKDFTFGTDNGHVFKNKDDGANKFVMKNVEINNCKAFDNGALLYNILTGTNKADGIYLQESINFVNCTGINIATKNRIRLGETNGTSNNPTFSSESGITISWEGTTTSIGIVVVAKGASRKEYFTLVNEDLGLFASTDLKLTQAYTVETKSDAQGAATLILPFESTIPDGVKAYKLNSVTDNTIATEDVTSKLPADTPVLINTKAEGGKYKFVSTNTTKDAEFATGSEAKTEGLLTGVYTETTVAEGNYILAKGDKGVGFYKSKGSSKVEANHAYLTIDNSSDSAKPSFFRVIGGGDGGTTLIKGVETNEEKAQEGVYNLNGVRMDKPERKGIYIVNGKKRIVK